MTSLIKTFLKKPGEPSPFVSTSIAAAFALAVILLSGCSQSSPSPAAGASAPATDSSTGSTSTGSTSTGSTSTALTSTASAHPAPENKVIFKSSGYDRQVQAITDKHKTDLAGALDILIKVQGMMQTMATAPPKAAAKAVPGAEGPPQGVMSKMMRIIKPSKLETMGELRNIMTQREMAVIVKHPQDRALWLQGAQLDLANDHPRVTVNTNKGAFVLEIRPQGAEITAASFIALASAHFYDHRKFDRYVPGLLIQGGSRNGDGTGGPGYTIPDEDGTMLHDSGTLAMAKPAPNKAGSEFYIALAPASQLDHHYTVFGLVVQGMDVVRNLTKGDTINSMTVTDLPEGYNTSEGAKLRRA